MNKLIRAFRFFFASTRFIKFNHALFNFSIRGLGILNYENIKVSGEENLINKILPKLVQNVDPIFFDIGANEGDLTKLLNIKFPRAIIYSFEPLPKNFQRLTQTKLPNVKYYNLALGAQKETLELYDRADLDGSAHASLYKEVISEIHKKDLISVKVPIETLDNIAIQEGIEFIDYLKIDTEGNDLNVLRGASLMLEKKAIGCIHFEFNEMNIVSRCFFRDFRKILEGYIFFRLLPKGMIELNNSPLHTEIFAFQNIFAIPCDKREM